MDGTQVPCLLPQPSRVIAQALWWSQLCSRCCSRLGSLSCTWPWKQLSKEPDTCGPSKRRAPREVLFGVFSFTALLFWTVFLRESCPASPSSLRYLDASNRLKESVFLPGEHGPLHCDCNTIFPLWGCECYSAKPCLKTSFIIHRLQTEIIFDNLCRKQAAFWLLASRLKGRKHMFTVRRSPWRKH